MANFLRNGGYLVSSNRNNRIQNTMDCNDESNSTKSEAYDKLKPNYQFNPIINKQRREESANCVSIYHAAYLRNSFYRNSFKSRCKIIIK